MQSVERYQAFDPVSDEKLVPQQIYIIRFEIKTQRAFAAYNRLPLCLIKSIAKQPQPVPGVFTQETDTGVEMYGTHQFDRVEPDAIHALQHWTHHGRRHAGRPKALVPVTQGRIDDLNAAHRRDLELQPSTTETSKLDQPGRQVRYQGNHNPDKDQRK